MTKKRGEQAKGSSAEDNKTKTSKEDRVCAHRQRAEITNHLPAKDSKNATSEERQEANDQRGSADSTLQESDNDGRQL